MRKIVALALVVLVAAAGVGAYVFSMNTASVTTENQVVVVEDGRTHVIRFVDAEGAPVVGVMANVCDDATCILLTIDDAADPGVGHFSGEEDHDYQLQILKAPEGFAFVQGEKIPLSENGETIITLDRE